MLAKSPRGSEVHEKDIWNDAAMVEFDAPVAGKNPGEVSVADNTRIPTHYHHASSHTSTTPEQNASWTASLQMGG